MKAEILANPGKLALVILIATLCAGFGSWLRFDSLSDRPLHADEATGARILADRLESDSYAFDPFHFHGPLLTALAEPVARQQGENDWVSLTPGTLRSSMAFTGALAVVLALAFAPWLGGPGALFAAAFVATSPFLVYYSRMFIHETLFGFLAIASVLAFFAYLEKATRWRALFLGSAVGLLMATRETFVICFFAWVAAGVLVGAERYRQGPPYIDPDRLRRLPVDAMLATLVASLIVAGFFTNWGTQPSGVIDFFRTFFLYETGEGHDKSFFYYAWLLLWPKFQGGVWWTEAGIGAAALLGFALSFRQPRGSWVRFLFYTAVVQWLASSLIAYKTPWLLLVGWLHLCLVAGAGMGYFWSLKGKMIKGTTIALVLPLLWWQHAQTDRAIHRYASDARNPYAYVPTSPDVIRVETFLTELSKLFPEIQSGPVAIIGSSYWPLPWYLRGIPATGYWTVLPEGAEEFPVLIALPSDLLHTQDRLKETHTFLPRGLRTDTPIFLFIRNDLWENYLNMDDPS